MGVLSFLLHYMARRKYRSRSNTSKSETTRSKVLNSIKDYYSGLKISDDIRKIPLSMNKYFKRDMKLSTRDIKDIYEKYNIVYYGSKQEYMNSKEAYELTDAQKKVLWEDYEYRHKLIISGQYEDYRTELFRDNYIKAMRRIGASEKEIQILENIPINQWSLMEITPNVEKDNLRDKLLPPLGLFHYDDKSFLSEVRNDIQKLLKDKFDIDYTWDEDSVISKSMKYLKKLVPYEDREDLITDGDEVELYTDMIRHVPFSKFKKTKPDKNGDVHYYIPGVGSEKGKNSQLIKDILKEYGL